MQTLYRPLIHIFIVGSISACASSEILNNATFPQIALAGQGGEASLCALFILQLLI